MQNFIRAYLSLHGSATQVSRACPCDCLPSTLGGSVVLFQEVVLYCFTTAFLKLQVSLIS